MSRVTIETGSEIKVEDVREILHDLRPHDLEEAELAGFRPTRAHAAEAYGAAMNVRHGLIRLDGKPMALAGFSKPPGELLGRVVQVSMLGRPGTHRVAPAYLDFIEKGWLRELQAEKVRILRLSAWEGNVWSMRFLRHPRLDAREIGTVLVGGEKFLIFERDLTEFR